ncbi:hypothetical protein [Oceanobacillus saliphilus]|uniref:hypothetical protein n=1 Tax=Oceanobacillus saliphilus TaxID=2925834 RepID=UPI00201DC8AB|nr:hypothetical protein [Oceanobacillus saliphilus]
MALKEDKPKKEYFNLSKDDKLDFDLEEEEKAEKDQAAKKVFEKLNEKYNK